MGESALPARRLWRKNVVRPLPALRSSTKDLLIDAGERLFGQYGFDGASLREVAEVAGQRNSNAVQYHFKDKREFISAILNARVRRIDALRLQRFEDLTRDRGGNLDARDLLNVIWLPDTSVTGTDGSHTYCRFALQYLLEPDAGDHPFYNLEAHSGKASPSAEGNRSCLFKATDLLRKQCEDLPRKTFYRSISTLSMMFLCSVVEHDNARAQGQGDRRTKYDIAPILTMSVRALSAGK